MEVYKSKYLFKKDDNKPDKEPFLTLEIDDCCDECDDEELDEEDFEEFDDDDECVLSNEDMMKVYNDIHSTELTDIPTEVGYVNTEHPVDGGDIRSFKDLVRFNRSVCSDLINCGTDVDQVQKWMKSMDDLCIDAVCTPSGVIRNPHTFTPLVVQEFTPYNKPSENNAPPIINGEDEICTLSDVDDTF